jgi:predicted tellurium resistance membrane protein TerC
MKQNHKEIKYLISSLIFMVLLNFPILSIFNKNSTVNGIPALFLYVFTVWAVFIGFIYWSVKKEEQQAEKDE